MKPGPSRRLLKIVRSRSAKERSRVLRPQDSYPTSYVRSPQDLSVVLRPTSAGPKKGPGDLSVGPSIWKEVGLSVINRRSGLVRRTDRRGAKIYGPLRGPEAP